MFRKVLKIASKNSIVINQLTHYECVGRHVHVSNQKYFSTSFNDINDVKNAADHLNISENVDNADNSGPEISEKQKEIQELLENSANFNEVGDKQWATTPYGESATKLLNDKPEREKKDPENTSVLMFPGQGTLRVGAIKKYLKYPRVRELFQIGREVLGYDILDICLNGPQEKLNKTKFNQAATVMTSLAAIEKMWAEKPEIINVCSTAMGYSVGELTALIFSGVMSMEEGIRLAGIRGAAMQYASDLEEQGMMTIEHKPFSKKIGPILKEALEWAVNMGVSQPVCQTAVYLYSETKVLGGHKAALNFIEKNKENYKLSKLVHLPVSGAFHTPLMEPALKSFKKALQNIEFEEPRISVYSNVTGEPYRNAMDIRHMLPKQMMKPVKWEQIIHDVYSRDKDAKFPNSYDMGSRGTMKTILLRVNTLAASQCGTF